MNSLKPYLFLHKKDYLEYIQKRGTEELFDKIFTHKTKETDLSVKAYKLIIRTCPQILDLKNISGIVRWLTEKAPMKFKVLSLDLCKFTLEYAPNLFSRDIIIRVVERFLDLDEDIKRAAHNIYNLAVRKIPNIIDEELANRIRKFLTCDLCNAQTTYVKVFRYHGPGSYTWSFKIRLCPSCSAKNTVICEQCGKELFIKSATTFYGEYICPEHLIFMPCSKDED